MKSTAMKSAKVIMSAALVFALALSTACNNDPKHPDPIITTPQGGTTSAAPSAEVTPEFAESKTYAAMSIMQRDTHALYANIKGIEVIIYRRGDDVYLNVMNIPQILIDGNEVKLDRGQRKAIAAPASQGFKDGLMRAISDWNKMIIVGGASIIGTGYASLKDEEVQYELGEIGDTELYYEDVRQHDGKIKRTFFNEDGAMVAIEQEDNDGKKFELKYYITAEVPERLGIPDGFELVD
jgi:hypothetical protein